ncbi:hypothetical protein N836_14170 [Leptolyngbya sp. Heron Island J]|nr:hypothetical protein N836_14170 [Leptolyngbya sp. Heron Island J]
MVKREEHEILKITAVAVALSALLELVVIF